MKRKKYLIFVAILILCLVLFLNLIGSKLGFEGWKKNRTCNKENLTDNVEFIEAASNGNVEQVRILLTKGANVNSQDKYGSTALIMAVRYGHIDVVELLLEFKADSNIRQIPTGMTALMVAAGKGNIDIVKALLKAKADINAKGNSGLTALWIAAAVDNTEIVKVLLEAKAEVNIKNNKGETALDIAKENGHTDVVNLLKQYGTEESIIINKAILVFDEKKWIG